LKCKDFPIKLTLNKLLEVMEFMKYIRFVFDWINLGEFAIVIDEGNIIFESSNRGGGRAPYIREHKC
jgi:hypothetical protein